MDDFKTNSHKSRETQLRLELPEKKVEKVIAGNAKFKKKNDIRKLTDVFISEDISNVKSYILMDVLVPAIKKAIVDIVTNGIDMVLYGETGRGRKKSTASKISYRNFYDRENDYRINRSISETRAGLGFDDVILDTRGEAEEVLFKMEEIISVYGVVSVADLYDMIDGGSCPHTYYKYGWTNVRNASVIRVHDGYLLKLPKAHPLNQKGE